MAEICKEGRWIDTATGKIVDRQPVEGHQVVAPGSELTGTKAQALEVAVGLYGYADDVETTTEPEVVETATELTVEAIGADDVETTTEAPAPKTPRGKR